MTLKNLIQLAEGLTPVESEIGYYILNNENKILDMSIVDLANNVHISKSAVHRFCKKLDLQDLMSLKLQ